MFIQQDLLKSRKLNTETSLTFLTRERLSSGLHILQEDLEEIFKRAVEGGVNFFDTAEVR